ncbi:MAG: hypothetical protein ACK4GG_09615 [Sphingomonas sp.]
MHIITAMQSLFDVFEPLCDDKQSLQALRAMASNKGRWRDAHGLFQGIRQKTLAAERRGDELRLAQYAFEEICAKTLYNLSRAPAPFDPDSAFWVLPLAIRLGARLGLDRPEQVSPLLEM